VSDTDRMVEEEFAALVRYCATYDPSFPDRLAGASEADLALIARTAKLPLPPEYRAFLRLMGRTPPGALDPFMNRINFGIAEIERFYREPSGPVPDDALYLWLVDPCFDTFLLLGEDDRRRVVELSWPFDDATGEYIPGERGQVIIAASLLQFLFREAFIEVRRRALDYHADLGELIRGEKPDVQREAERKQAFRRLAKRLAFAPVPHLDNGQIAFDRQDAALLLQVEQVAPDSLYVSAATEKELIRLCELFCDNLDFTRS
jgi:hypothetical protein